MGRSQECQLVTIEKNHIITHMRITFMIILLRHTGVTLDHLRICECAGRSGFSAVCLCNATVGAAPESVTLH